MLGDIARSPPMPVIRHTQGDATRHARNEYPSARPSIPSWRVSINHPPKKILVAEPATRSESGLFVKLLLRGGVSGGALSDTRAIILITSTKCVRHHIRTFGTIFAQMVLEDYLLPEDATYRSCRTRLIVTRYVPDF